jgi:DNA polymerase III delta prime subunit
MNMSQNPILTDKDIDKNEYIFVEKYRPKTIDSLIVTDDLKAKLRSWVEDEEMPNILLASRSPGLGKTSLAHVLINEIGADTLFVNASLESNIDLLRSKIQGFASTSSFDGNPKIVVLDEADYLNPNSTQPALRGFIEQFSKNARFILTCNYKNKLIEPLRDRLMLIDFDEMFQKHKAELIKKTAQRTIAILKNEDIEYTKDDLLWLIKHYFPSNRSILNKIQQSIEDKKLIINKEEVDTDNINNEIIRNIMNGDFKALRTNCERLPDPSSVFLTLFENIDDFPQTLRPTIIITIAKYQAYDPQVRDRLINSVACCTEIMEILNK